MLPGMTNRTQRTEPNWQPLEALLGIRLCAYFMWMGEYHLDDGTPVQAYKHVATRRYLHLDSGGRAFAYLEAQDGYREVPVEVVLDGCFARWEALLPTPDDEDLAALERVRSTLARARG
jgi:hypothetical protein